MEQTAGCRTLPGQLESAGGLGLSGAGWQGRRTVRWRLVGAVCTVALVGCVGIASATPAQSHAASPLPHAAGGSPKTPATPRGTHRGTANGCSFATGGTGYYAETLCWLDLSAYDPVLAAKPAGQPFTVTLPGGYTIQFNLHVTGAPVKPVAFPTYPGSFLGNRGFYTGVTGRPALYQTTQGTTTTACSTTSR